MFNILPLRIYLAPKGKDLLFAGEPLKLWRCSIWGIYCWWKKSCTTSHVKNPVNDGINYLPTGAGFLPSTVSISSRLLFVQWSVCRPQVCHKIWCKGEYLQKTNMEPKKLGLEDDFLFKQMIFRFHVSFRGCISTKTQHINKGGPFRLDHFHQHLLTEKSTLSQSGSLYHLESRWHNSHPSWFFMAPISKSPPNLGVALRHRSFHENGVWTLNVFVFFFETFVFGKLLNKYHLNLWTQGKFKPTPPKKKPFIIFHRHDPSWLCNKTALPSFPLAKIVQRRRNITWTYPPRSNSHHQDYYIFNRESL